MKLTKFMCAAFAAAIALVSCQKEADNAPVNTNFKSVEVSINNIQLAATKSLGSNQDLTGKKIQLNSLQFFFSDGTTFYTAKNADQTLSDVYLDASELNALNGNISLSFHFLPSAVKEVVVVGNLPELNVGNKTGIDRVLEVANLQDITNFPLYAEGTLTTNVVNDHEQGNAGHVSNVYKVTLNVLPCVARFEIKKIGCNFESSNKTITVKSMAFADFYDKCDFRSGLVDIQTLRSVDLTQQGIFNYFANTMNKSKWNNDFFDGSDARCPEVVLTPTNASVDVNIAYNFFCNGHTTSPVHLLNIIEKVGEGADNPAYLFTNTYKMNSGSKVTTFEPGKIYRMNIVFNEDKLQHQDRCLDITVNVASWDLIEVTPEF